MLLRFLPALGLSLIGGAFSAQPNATVDRDIQLALKQGKGTAEGRQAWERIAQAGPEMLPVLLKAMDTNDVVALNWLRTAFDGIVDRQFRAGVKGSAGVDADALLGFVQDAAHQGRPRRLALEVVERLRPGTSVKLYVGWLDDREFRHEAVDLALASAQKQAQAGDKGGALATYVRAFDAARDMVQARKAAAGLQSFGKNPSVAAHMGFLVDWYLAGPFDGMGMKGFHTAYPPEKGVDLKAEYQGQGDKKLRWVPYKAREPAYTSGDRHQALVNLRERDALGDADDAVAFAYTEFTVGRAQDAEFRGAADDNFTVWVNGKRAFGFEEYRNGIRHDRHRFKAHLKAGRNTVLVKICQTPAPNTEPNWEFFLRVVDDTEKGIAMTNGMRVTK
jgi:hypothetical protein